MPTPQLRYAVHISFTLSLMLQVHHDPTPPCKHTASVGNAIASSGSTTVHIEYQSEDASGSDTLDNDEHIGPKTCLQEVHSYLFC